MTRYGYGFVGWFTAPTGGNQITNFSIFSTPDNSVILYAHWKEKATAAIDDNTQTYVYDGREKDFSVINAAGLTGFTVGYSQDGTKVEHPINVGTYDVMIGVL